MRARVLAALTAEENRKWVTLAAVSFGLFMIMLDNTVVNVALPTMQRDLHVSLSQLEWVVIAYALTFASLLITGGKLADLYGRRRIFVVGLVIFTLSSLACGLASSAGFLIGARAVQGAGAALMNPATLSIIVATFPPRQRGQAIGIWAGVSALALAIGPLGGGLIVDNLNWNWIFFVNVPVGILAIVVSQFAIRESRDTSAEQSIDLPGLLTSIGFLFSLSYALVEGNSHGWTSPEILGLFATAAVLLVAFVVLEHRQRLPMLDLSLFKIGAFTGSNVVAMLVTLSMFGVFFFVSLYIQNILGYSADPGGRRVPADGLADHPHRTHRRQAVRPGRLTLAHGRGDDARRHLAPAVRARHRPLQLLDAVAVDDPRRGRHGADDVADDLGRDGCGAGGQGRRGVRRPEQLPPGRRLARDRGHGCDRRLVPPSPAAQPTRRPGLRQRAPCRLRRRRGDHFRGSGRRRRHRADAARGRARAMAEIAA